MAQVYKAVRVLEGNVYGSILLAPELNPIFYRTYALGVTTRPPDAYPMAWLCATKDYYSLYSWLSGGDELERNIAILLCEAEQTRPINRVCSSIRDQPMIYFWETGRYQFEIVKTSGMLWCSSITPIRVVKEGHLLEKKKKR